MNHKDIDDDEDGRTKTTLYNHKRSRERPNEDDPRRTKTTLGQQPQTKPRKAERRRPKTNKPELATRRPCYKNQSGKDERSRKTERRRTNEREMKRSCSGQLNSPRETENAPSEAVSSFRHPPLEGRHKGAGLSAMYQEKAMHRREGCEPFGTGAENHYLADQHRSCRTYCGCAEFPTFGSSCCTRQRKRSFSASSMPTRGELKIPQRSQTLMVCCSSGCMGTKEGLGKLQRHSRSRM